MLKGARQEMTMMRQDKSQRRQIILEALTQLCQGHCELTSKCLGKMAEKRQSNEPEVIGTKHGFRVYAENPSIVSSNAVPVRSRPVKIANGQRAMIIGSDTGELLGEAQASFFEMEEVDTERFIKLYLDGVKGIANLEKAGRQVFQIVYTQMRDNPHTDKIELNVYLANKFGMQMSARTFQRGLRELLENELLYRSPSADVYFVNIKYMFNGNRINLAKSYFLKERSKQQELPFVEKMALAAPGGGHT